MSDKQNAAEFLKFTDAEPGWGLPPECTTGALNFLKAQGSGSVLASMKATAQHVIVGGVDIEEPVEVSVSLDDEPEELDEAGDKEMIEGNSDEIIETS